MAQATETIKQTVKDAVLAMEPATLETGVVDARRHNSERRSSYRSAEESEMTYLRAIAAEGGKKKKDAPRVIATMGAFAAHPVTQDHTKGVAHADWPGYFAARAEERFGGIGMHFMTGPRQRHRRQARGARRDRQRHPPEHGTALGDLLPPVGTAARSTPPTCARPAPPGSSRSPTCRSTRSARRLLRPAVRQHPGERQRRQEQHRPLHVGRAAVGGAAGDRGEDR
jgi:hypothetical protein